MHVVRAQTASSLEVAVDAGHFRFGFETRGELDSWLAELKKRVNCKVVEDDDGGRDRPRSRKDMDLAPLKPTKEHRGSRLPERERDQTLSPRRDRADKEKGEKAAEKGEKGEQDSSKSS